MIRYPNGKIYQKKAIKQHTNKNELSISAKNRGMSLEHEIDLSNEYYVSKNIALVYKRPTPINVVKVDYTRGARIIDAYFEKQSTTDYNGLYKGKYLDFEAKSTKSKTSFPLSNIYSHQIEHLKKVIAMDGIAFFIIQFEIYQEVYFLPAKFVIDFFEKNERESIPYFVFQNEGILLKNGYLPRINYIDAIEEKFFKNKENN